VVSVIVWLVPPAVVWFGLVFLVEDRNTTFVAVGVFTHQDKSPYPCRYSLIGVAIGFSISLYLNVESKPQYGQNSKSVTETALVGEDSSPTLQFEHVIPCQVCFSGDFIILISSVICVRDRRLPYIDSNRGVRRVHSLSPKYGGS